MGGRGRRAVGGAARGAGRVCPGPGDGCARAPVFLFDARASHLRCGPMRPARLGFSPPLPHPAPLWLPQWDKVENKTSVIVYGAGSIVALWLASTVIGALNSIPLLPKVFELVGLTYSAWFTYRYLLFKSSREELVEDIDSLKKKISGEQ